MTERWVSLKKYYCKYCNTWIPDTKVGRQQHELTDRHKNAMQRNVARIQREEVIKRHQNPSLAPPTVAKTTAAPPNNSRSKNLNTANYGYGERDDMIGFIAEGKKMKFEDVPIPQAPLPKEKTEGTVGQWQVTQIIMKDGEDEENKDGVKKEESDEAEDQKLPGAHVSQDTGKRERARTPDKEDLFRFQVKEKAFPGETLKDEEEDTKVASVGFKKRKIGGKNSRISTAL